MRLAVAIIFGIGLGFFGGISFPSSNIAKVYFQNCCIFCSTAVCIICLVWQQLRLTSSIMAHIEDRKSGLATQGLLNHAFASAHSRNTNNSILPYDDSSKVFEKLIDCDIELYSNAWAYTFLIILLY